MLKETNTEKYGKQLELIRTINHLLGGYRNGETSDGLVIQFYFEPVRPRIGLVTLCKHVKAITKEMLWRRKNNLSVSVVYPTVLKLLQERLDSLSRPSEICSMEPLVLKRLGLSIPLQDESSKRVNSTLSMGLRRRRTCASRKNDDEDVIEFY